MFFNRPAKPAGHEDISEDKAFREFASILKRPLWGVVNFAAGDWETCPFVPLISNDPIRSQLILLYGMAYPAIDVMENQLPQFQHFDLIFEFVRKNFSRSSKTEYDTNSILAIEPLHYDLISKDPEFRLLLAHSRKWREVSVRYYGRLIDRIKALLTDINKEIGNTSVL